LQCVLSKDLRCVLQCVAECRVLQCVAVCIVERAPLSVEVCCIALHCVAVCCIALHCFAVCCIVLHCAVWCSVLNCTRTAFSQILMLYSSMKIWENVLMSYFTHLNDWCHTSERVMSRVCRCGTSLLCIDGRIERASIYNTREDATGTRTHTWINTRTHIHEHTHTHTRTHSNM